MTDLGLLYGQGACAPVAADADGEVYLVLGMGVGVEAVDAAVEDVCPTHLQEGGKLLVVAARDEAQEVVLAVFVVNDLHGVGVVRILHVALQTQGLSNTQIVPYKVGVVVLAASQVAVHKERLMCFHRFKDLRVNTTFCFTMQKYMSAVPKNGTL